jgi:hypothetical protein
MRLLEKWRLDENNKDEDKGARFFQNGALRA